MSQLNVHPMEPVSLPHPRKLLMIEALDYPNPYDFHRPHRHDYFELILVKGGSGSQLIDFSPHAMSAGQLFAIYPGQVHLMHRESAEGLIIQFRKDVFEFIHPVKHHHLYFPQPAFCPDAATFDHLYDLTGRMQLLTLREELSQASSFKAYSYLQIVLLTLLELQDVKTPVRQDPNLAAFLSLLPRHIRSRKKVAEYCLLIGCSTDTLNTACKKALGKTALELIHEELLLEVRRLMLLSDLSLKEIAYELDFDSQANFSGFVKARTGMTPSELQQAVVAVVV